MLSVSGRIFEWIHLFMLWPSPGVVLLWGEMCQQLHEAQAHVSHFWCSCVHCQIEHTYVIYVHKKNGPNKYVCRWRGYLAVNISWRGYTRRKSLRTTSLEVRYQTGSSRVLGVKSNIHRKSLSGMPLMSTGSWMTGLEEHPCVRGFRWKSLLESNAMLANASSHWTQAGPVMRSMNLWDQVRTKTWIRPEDQCISF